MVGVRREDQTPGPRLSWAHAGEHTHWRQAPEPLWPMAILDGTYGGSNARLHTAVFAVRCVFTPRTPAVGADYPSLTGLHGSSGMSVGGGKLIYEYGVYFPPAYTELEWCTMLFRHPISTYRLSPSSSSPAT